ncbi:MAG: hypothetical protein ACM37Z_18550, partial [Deltaproteobacteria bacterium]
YESAWKTFYSKENMIRVLSRWTDHTKNYWNLMSVFFWYKNAALIEKQHPMVAGFFRLKERKSRRPGFAIDPIFVHFWKRSKETVLLFIAWAKFLKEMEEVWLQTRKKSETEERWLEQIQKIQGDIWQALRVAEVQKIYSTAKEALPEKAKSLLEPLEELSSKILFSRKDLKRFLKQWETLQQRIQELRQREGETARRWLDEMYNIQVNTRLGDRLHEWQDAYVRLRRALPSKAHLGLLKFDALNNRVIYSRYELQRIWSQSVTNLRQMKWWQIRPWKLTNAFVKDFFLTTSFAVSYREFSKH